ncbi:MAG: hypothetical protein HN793_05285 [Rhodospirillaceae bacterium]|jgi:hypothetical protein|nr:hypothetical protein [Rhodospirillaceae bacterium]MBT5241769.1 hypothetical protein [Rhodospirillaceae bacterium]MBT5566496.1 hypothetical protein [Rhodospirillaceae bacterium]MBT6088394.1 hypothetical protein [Rhodospirillaceae bacterium]MBT6962104.1 hypothetical protein [Rhodospirillaceae bacterium]
MHTGAVPAEQVVGLLSRVFLVMAIAFGTALITCLSALPNASSKPELVDLYVLISRFSLSGLIGAFLWYVPLVFRVRLEPTSGWRNALRWGLSAVSIIGAGTIMLVLVRIVGDGNALLSAIARRFGTEA